MKTIKSAKNVTGTKEWAKKNANCVSGCSHDCFYCYARSISVRFRRKTAQTWKNEIVLGAKPIGGKPCRVMFPTTHDITPNTLPVCSNQIQLILDGGHEILIVSKPHLDCVAAICKRFKGYKKKILFRFTIGSAANETLKFWEPNAPSLDERLQALKLAHQQGFQTSISCEPMLDDNIEAVVKLVEPYVTTDIWIGKMNHVRARLSHNKATAEVVAAGEALIKMQCDENIKSLYARLKNHPKIMWKDTIKKVVGIEAPQASDLASRWTMRTTE